MQLEPECLPLSTEENGSESQKKKKKVSLGASKPLFSSAKQTRQDIILLLCVQVLLTKIQVYIMLNVCLASTQ